MATPTFGEFVKQRRAEHRITLRSFAAAVNADPANYSKVERGKLPPPRDHATLERYREVLAIAPETPDHRELLRLAALDRGEIPARVLSDRELAGKLPAIFCSLEEGDAQPISPEERRVRNQRAIALLEKWAEEGDEAEQRETFEALRRGLNESHSSDRVMFP